MTESKAAEPQKPLLDLDTLDPDPEDRPFVRIDGERYNLAVGADFGLLEFNRLDRLVRRVTALQPEEDGDLSDETAAALSGALREALVMVLRAPTPVVELLSDPQRLAIIRAFSSASPTTPNRAKRRAAAKRSRTRSTGARSFPDSGGSIQARATG